MSGTVQKGFAWVRVEKVRAGDLRKVVAINQVARGQIEGGQVGGMLADLAGKNLFQQVRVGERAPGEALLPRIGADIEGAAAAGRVQDDGLGFADAKGVDEIGYLWPRVMLAPPMPLLGSEQILEDVADDILVEVAKVKVVQQLDEGPPPFDRRIGQERDAVNEPAVKDRLVIVRNDFGLVKKLGEKGAQSLRLGNMLGNFQFRAA